MEKLNNIKFQNAEGKLYIYSTFFATENTSYFVCKHQHWIWSIKKKTDVNDDITIIRNTAKSKRKKKQLGEFLSWSIQPNDWEPENFNLPTKLNLIMKSLFNTEDEESSRRDWLRYSLRHFVLEMYEKKQQIQIHKLLKLGITSTVSRSGEYLLQCYRYIWMFSSSKSFE